MNRWSRQTCGWVFWLGIIGWTVGWDGPAVRRRFETGSCAFGRAVIRHPRVMAGVWALVTLHLFGVLLPAPVRRLDPIGGLARLIEGERS